MPRREFTKAVKVEIVRRATVAGVTRCEECGCAPKTWHIDHTSPDALQVDKTHRLTAGDGKLLCAGSRETCHGRKTAEEDVPAIAKAKRREAKHLGIKKLVRPAAQIRSAPFATSPKAARRAERGHKPSLPPRLPRGFVPATDRSAS